MQTGRRVAVEVERTIYVIAGLPLALRGGASARNRVVATLHRAFAHRYWAPRNVRERLELVAGLILAPLVVPLAALWFTLRNGPVIRRREGKGLARQFLEQLRLYANAGIVGPWYYILSLHRDGERRAPTFLQRCETKFGIYTLLRPSNASPLGNKLAFEKRCVENGIRCVRCIAVVDGKPVNAAWLPNCDLFVKPLRGRGGKGAERWDRIAHGRWSNGMLSLDADRLVDHLNRKGRPLLIQPRVVPHRELAALTSGALPTVRVLTCIDEEGRPEVVATVFRMSCGCNRTVDNIHAGGIACRVSVETGRLGKASDLGADAHFGWHSNHPTTGAQIERARLPFWDETKGLAINAHRAFADRLFIGWDIAITDDGPIIVEGNGGPDMDLMQRFMDRGFCDHHRFGELLAHHLKVRGYAD